LYRKLIKHCYLGLCEKLKRKFVGVEFYGGNMTVYQYNEGDHPAGFIGLRVAVMVNGNHKQKYFNFAIRGTNYTFHSLEERNEMLLKAKALDQTWLYQKEAQATTREGKAKERRPTLYSTGVSGIKMKFVKTKRQRKSGERIYYTPSFVVAGSNNSRKFGKNFNILTQGYQKAWISAVLYYMINKNLTPAKDITKRLPPVEKFMVIFIEEHKNGGEIPKHRLPPELWDNTQVQQALVAN
jgi:hypothetical protein